MGAARVAGATGKPDERVARVRGASGLDDEQIARAKGISREAEGEAARIERAARKAGARVGALERSIARELAKPDATSTLRTRLRAAWWAWRRGLANLEHRARLHLRRMVIWLRVRARLQTARRRRRVLAYLKGAHEPSRAELASSALLAVLTERVARAGTTDASSAEITETVAQAEHVVAWYRRQIAELEPLLAKAHGRTERWVRWSSVAEAKGSPALVARATEYRNSCETEERELAKAIDDCHVGCRRLHDAIEQLQALAARSTAPNTR